jgi:6-phosphogluconolactonase (cycloisomerase 2 family)
MNIVSFACFACTVTVAALALPTAVAAQRTVYVTNGGGNVGTFAISPSGGLVPHDLISGVGNTLRGIAIAPDGRTAYIVDSDRATVTSFAIAGDGRLTQVGDVVATDPNPPLPLPPACGPGETGPSPCPFGIAVAPNGRRVYIANSNSNTISVLSVRHDGSLRLSGAPISTGGIGPRGLAVSPDGGTLYVLNRNTDSISVFGIHKNGKVALRGEPFRIPGCAPAPGNPPTPQCSPFWGSITPDGRWLYVVNQVSGDLLTLAVGADGALTAVNRIPIGGRPEGIAITADIRFLYVSIIDDNAVKAFAIGRDGALTFLASSPTCDEAHIPAACGGVSTAVAPDGATLYVATTFKPINDVLSFAIDDTGRLTQLSAIPSGGDSPLFQALTIRPNQGPVAALARSSDAIGKALAFDASSSFDPDGQIARYDWDFGDGQRMPDAGAHAVHIYSAPGHYRVTVTITDNEGCSTTQVFTGQTALCNGSDAAVASRLIHVR